MGISKCTFKREVYINTRLPQEIRKISNKQTKQTTKTTTKKKKKKKLVEGKKS